MARTWISWIRSEITRQHYAFIVGEPEFDEIFKRIRELSLSYWADPAQKRRGEINHHDNGRGVLFRRFEWTSARSNHEALRQRRLESVKSGLRSSETVDTSAKLLKEQEGV